MQLRFGQAEPKKPARLTGEVSRGGWLYSPTVERKG